MFDKPIPLKHSGGVQLNVTHLAVSLVLIPSITRKQAVPTSALSWALPDYPSVPETRVSGLNFRLISFFLGWFSPDLNWFAPSLYQDGTLSDGQKAHTWVGNISYLSRSVIYFCSSPGIHTPNTTDQPTLSQHHGIQQWSLQLIQVAIWQFYACIQCILITVLSHSLLPPPSLSALIATLSLPDPFLNSWLSVLFCEPFGLIKVSDNGFVCIPFVTQRP